MSLKKFAIVAADGTRISAGIRKSAVKVSIKRPTDAFIQSGRLKLTMAPEKMAATLLPGGDPVIIKTVTDLLKMVLTPAK